MNKKGMGWEIIVLIVVILVSFAIILVWQIGYGKQVEEEVKATTCRLSVMQAGMTQLAALQKGELPRLNCPKIPIEIKSDNKEGIMKELLDLMVKTSEDFGASKIFSRKHGRYCRRRYHPVTFTKKDLGISKAEFGNYIKDKDIKLMPRIPNDIDTNKDYSILFVADYDKSVEGWMEWFAIGKRFESEKEAVVLVEDNVDKLRELECKHII